MPAYVSYKSNILFYTNKKVPVCSDNDLIYDKTSRRKRLKTEWRAGFILIGCPEQRVTRAAEKCLDTVPLFTEYWQDGRQIRTVFSLGKLLLQILPDKLAQHLGLRRHTQTFDPPDLGILVQDLMWVRVDNETRRG